MTPREEKRELALAEELGHDNIVKALKHALEMRSALRVIRTWANVPSCVNWHYVIEIIERALK